MSDGIEATKLLTHRVDCDQQNTLRLEALQGETVGYVAVDEGFGSLLEQLRNICPVRFRPPIPTRGPSPVSLPSLHRQSFLEASWPQGPSWLDIP